MYVYSLGGNNIAKTKQKKINLIFVCVCGFSAVKLSYAQHIDSLIEYAVSMAPTNLALKFSNAYVHNSYYCK